MTDVTRILSAIEQGDPSAAEQLLPLVYDELRKLAAQKMAQEKPGQTLQATALVHEAYIRLVDVEKAQHWDQPGAFLCGGGRGDAADSGREAPDAKDSAQARRRAAATCDLERVEIAVTEPSLDDLLAVDEALDKLAAEDPPRRELVKLRFFAGLSIEEAAEALGISSRNC